ncbi:unnamed protein product [Caenorhabditis brenneri]
MNTNPATMSMYTSDENVTLLLDHIDSLELGELILFASNTDKHFIEFDERQMTRGFAHTKPKIARYSKFVEIFAKIIDKFDAFQVDFKNSPIGECVEEYFHKLTNLLIPGITVPGAKQFMDDYRVHNERSKKNTRQMALSIRKRYLNKSQLSREELRETDQAYGKMAVRQFIINKINACESREKTWGKWLEMRELLKDGIQLTRGLETWKVLYKKFKNHLLEYPEKMDRILPVIDYFPDSALPDAYVLMRNMEKQNAIDRAREQINGELN